MYRSRLSVVFGCRSVSKNIEVQSFNNSHCLYLSRVFLRKASATAIKKNLEESVESVLNGRNVQELKLHLSETNGSNSLHIARIFEKKKTLKRCTLKISKEAEKVVDRKYVAHFAKLTKSLCIHFEKICSGKMDLKSTYPLVHSLVDLLEVNSSLLSFNVKFRNSHPFLFAFAFENNKVTCKTRFLSLKSDSISCDTLWFSREVLPRVSEIVWQRGYPSKFSLEVPTKIGSSSCYFKVLQHIDASSLVQTNIRKYILQHKRLMLVYLVPFGEIEQYLPKSTCKYSFVLAAMMLSIDPFLESEAFNFHFFQEGFLHILMNLLYKGNVKLKLPMQRSFRHFRRNSHFYVRSNRHTHLSRHPLYDYIEKFVE